MKLKPLIENIVLYEGLIYTHEIESSVNLLNRYASNDSMVFFIDNSSHSNSIKLQIPPTRIKDFSIKDFDNAIKTCNNLGWYPTHYKYGDWFAVTSTNYERESFVKFISEYSGKVNLFFDAKYDSEISIDKLPSVAYHITPEKHLKKILKIGLVPKSKHQLGIQPSRIYLAYKKDGIDILARHYKFYPDETKFIIFEIDVKELAKSKRVKFFNDSAFEDYGIYTYDNLPPQYMKPTDTYDR